MLKNQVTGILALAMIASPAMATEADVETSTPETAVEAEVSSPFAKAKPIAEASLATIAGREDINQLTNADQTNSVSDNEVGDNSVTGELSISDRAFSNTTGFIILNANTGNNVAINASIQVNVALPQTGAAGQ